MRGASPVGPWPVSPPLDRDQKAHCEIREDNEIGNLESTESGLSQESEIWEKEKGEDHPGQAADDFGLP